MCVGGVCGREICESLPTLCCHQMFVHTYGRQECGERHKVARQVKATVKITPR